MPQFTNLKAPAEGAAITRKNGRLIVPDCPIIPFIEGDGTGRDIWRASVRVFDSAVKKAFDGQRRVVWLEAMAGEKAKDATGEWLPADTLEAAKTYKVAIKGPLTTPVGGGIRSLNVTLRQVLEARVATRGGSRYHRDILPRIVAGAAFLFLEDLPPANDLAFAALSNAWQPLHEDLVRLDAVDDVDLGVAMGSRTK